MKKEFILALSAALLFSCHTKKQAPIKEDSVRTGHSQVSSTKYSLDMVDNKKDPSCGMPLTAGIEDTCHYAGKVYGFCSKECKEDFLKNAEAYLKAK